MVAILFTNSYNSGIISTLNAPLPQVRIENWNYVIQDCHRAEIGGLTNISILNWMNNMGISKYWGDVTEIELMISDKLENPFESENCFRLLSPSGQRNRRFFDLYPPSYDRPANKFFNYEDNVHTQVIHELTNGRFEGRLTNEILLLNPMHGRELKDFSERIENKTKK